MPGRTTGAVSGKPDHAGRPPNGRLRVLVIAEMCNPTWASVPLVGYSMARALAEHPALDVTVATHVRNRAALANDPLLAVADVRFIDNEFIARPLHRFARLLRGGERLAWTLDTALMWPSYVVFEKLVHAHFDRELSRRRFDLVHRVTPLTPTIPSPLASLTRVPMVLGPLNGGLPWPREHPGLRRREREWLAPVRRCYRVLPYFRSTYRNVAGVIAGSRHTASEVPAHFHGRRLLLPENGVDPQRFPLALNWREPVGNFRFLTAARLVPFKGVRFVVEAMGGSALLRRCELVICGDGPERPTLEERVRELGLEGVVRFLGWTEHTGLHAEMARAQAFVLPSLRDFGGGVVLEAMASGLPTVVVDYGGPGELVTPETGLRIPMAASPALVASLRAAMESLAGDPDLCRRLGNAGVEAVRRQHVWSAKADRVVQFYEEVLRDRAGRGDKACANGAGSAACAAGAPGGC